MFVPFKSSVPPVVRCRGGWPLAVLLAMLLGGAVRADVVRLDGGDRVSGTLQAIDGSAVVIETTWGGVVTIDRASVISVVTDQPLQVELADGEEGERRLVVAAGGEQGVMVDGAVREVGFGNVRRATLEVETEPLREAWTTHVDYGLNFSRGNSDTQTHAVRAGTSLRIGDYRHAGRFELDRKADGGEVTKDEYRLAYQLDWFFRPDWFAYGSSEYFRNEPAEIAHRLSLGLGFGHQFWDTSLGALAAELGLSEVLEEVEGNNESNPAFRWALDFNRHLYGSRLELFHRQDLLVPVHSDSGRILDTATGLRLAVSDRWDADLRVEVDHVTDPAPDREKTDITYIIGVGVDL